MHDSMHPGKVPGTPDGGWTLNRDHLENQIVVYCDGACSGNPGPGGWGTIVSTTDGRVRELGGGALGTTNNQMELTATIEALKMIDDAPGEIVIYTDSVYVIRGITQWIWGWIRNGWKTAEGKEVLNREYWQELSKLVSERKKISATNWKYVRGHVGIQGNERCDEIAVRFSQGQRPSLFNGTVHEYPIDVRRKPPEEPLPEMRSKSGPKPGAHSYLSLLGGTPMRHGSWAECERRVKGQPGAKFKKAMSAGDEIAILKSWGVDPGKLK